MIALVGCVQVIKLQADEAQYGGEQVLPIFIPKIWEGQLR